MLNDCFKEMLFMPRYSEKFKLPVGYGITNNPWFELAVAQKILRQNGGPELDFSEFSTHCLIPGKEPMRSRWPGNKGGAVSQDEMIGRGFMAPYLAKNDLEVIGRSWGFYRNDPEYPLWKSFHAWRFPWVMAFLQARAGGSISNFKKDVWNFRSMVVSQQPPSEGTAHLLTWLMVDEMKKISFCKEHAEHWESNVRIYDVMRNYFGNGSWHVKWVKQ